MSVMKTRLFTILFLSGLSVKCFAAAGYASDGLYFLLCLSAFLLIIALILYTADYLKKNMQRLKGRAFSMLRGLFRRILSHLWSHFRPVQTSTLGNQ